LTATETRVKGATDKAAVWVTLPRLAEIVADVWAVTNVDVTVNVAVELPLDTVIVAGTPTDF
jgi:hypothetical protein